MKPWGTLLLMGGTGRRIDHGLGIVTAAVLRPFTGQRFVP